MDPQTQPCIKCGEYDREPGSDYCGEVCADEAEQDEFDAAEWAELSAEY